MKFTNPLRTSMYATVGALLLTLSSFAQAPEKMSYQAVIRGANNALVTNQQIGMQISILQGSTAVYEETQTLTSNPNGLVSLEIGKGTIVSGIFSSIDWSADMYFIKIETDPTGGTNYTITGTSQLLSVPYALYAKTSSDTEAVAANTAKVGYTDALVSANTSDIATNTTNIATKVSITDIVDDLTTGGTTAPLSAEQGKVLKGLVDSSVNIVVEDVLTSSSTINALSANQGRELKGLINTNTNNILTNTSDIANAVMTSGDQTVAGIKTFSNPIVSDVTGNLTGNVTGNAGTVTNGVYTTSSVTALSDVTDVGSGAIITGAERAKLATIESSADVTDATNVTAAGALMDSEVSDLAGIKAVTVSTLQVKPSEGAFADGDKTKLDGIEDNADVTDATNVTAAGALMDSEVSDLAGIKAVTVSTLQVKPSEGAFADGDKTKLDGIEDNADVTDATNVTAAGALMDSEVSDLAGIKAVTVSTLQVKPSEGAFADGDKTKLDGITIHFIGESYGGGIVFFVYDGGQHGLIAATADRGNSLQRIAGVPWFGGSYTNTRARADGIGAGLKNTAIIIADQVPEVENTGIFNDFAATLCNEYSVTEGDVTYGDWYLPSKYELDKMYLNKETINDAALLNGGSKFLTNLYWSSTENGYYSAWRQNFADGSQYSNSKSFPANVRAVRAF